MTRLLLLQRRGVRASIVCKRVPSIASMRALTLARRYMPGIRKGAPPQPAAYGGGRADGEAGSAGGKAAPPQASPPPGAPPPAQTPARPHDPHRARQFKAPPPRNSPSVHAPLRIASARPAPPCTSECPVQLLLSERIVTRWQRAPASSHRPERDGGEEGRTAGPWRGARFGWRRDSAGWVRRSTSTCTARAPRQSPRSTRSSSSRLRLRPSPLSPPCAATPSLPRICKSVPPAPPAAPTHSHTRRTQRSPVTPPPQLPANGMKL
jgi:hypothetical protein